VKFQPFSFVENILEYEAAADVFCGKSGNILAESTFFGNPSIVTHCANLIEHNIADHYMNTVGCTIKQFNVKKAVALIRDFARNESLIKPYRDAAV
jgi:UDP-N-acetylglucosamine:LPS N-acetylglucosamine transferase